MKIVLVELRHGTTRGVGDGTRAVASPPRALFRAKESIRRVQHRGERLRGGTVPGVVRSSRPLEPLVHGRVRRASKPRPPLTRARRRARNPRRRARAARRRRRPIPRRQVPPDSSAAADGVRAELRERGDDALFDPRQCRVVSTGSGGGRGFP